MKKKEYVLELSEEEYSQLLKSAEGRSMSPSKYLSHLLNSVNPRQTLILDSLHCFEKALKVFTKATRRGKVDTAKINELLGILTSTFQGFSDLVRLDRQEQVNPPAMPKERVDTQELFQRTHMEVTCEYIPVDQTEAFMKAAEGKITYALHVDDPTVPHSTMIWAPESEETKLFDILQKANIPTFINGKWDPYQDMDSRQRDQFVAEAWDKITPQDRVSVKETLDRIKRLEEASHKEPLQKGATVKAVQEIGGRS